MLVKKCRNAVQFPHQKVLRKKPLLSENKLRDNGGIVQHPGRQVQVKSKLNMITPVEPRLCFLFISEEGNLLIQQNITRICKLTLIAVNNRQLKQLKHFIEAYF